MDMTPTAFSPMMTDSWQKCASKCKHQNNCNHWQFVPHNNKCSFAIKFRYFRPKINVTAGARTCPNNDNNIFTLCPTGDGTSSMWKNAKMHTFYNPDTKVETGK